MKHRAAIITAFNPFEFKGGIETYSVQMMDLLKEHNIPCDLYSIDEHRKGQSFHNSYLGALYDVGRRVFDRRGDYDLVIINAFYGLGYFPPSPNTFNVFHLTHIGFAEAIKDAVPRAQYIEWKYLWGDFCESVSGYGRGRIAVSESVSDELKTHYGFDDIKVLNNAVDTRKFRKIDQSEARRRWQIPEGVFTGLYVGRWDLLKGSDLLEQTMRAIPDIHWILVLGTGVDRRLVPSLENISVFDQLEHELMHEIYSAADFMLFPSRYEGFGYVIIEAMACGLPVITTNVGVARTIYQKGPFRDLLLPGTGTGPDAVAGSACEYIGRLRSDNGFREYIAEEGRILIERDFEIEQWKKKAAALLGL